VSDGRLRELERRAAATGAPGDLEALDRERLRCGRLDPPFGRGNPSLDHLVAGYGHLVRDRYLDERGRGMWRALDAALTGRAYWPEAGALPEVVVRVEPELVGRLVELRAVVLVAGVEKLRFTAVDVGAWSGAIYHHRRPGVVLGCLFSGLVGYRAELGGGLVERELDNATAIDVQRLLAERGVPHLRCAHESKRLPGHELVIRLEEPGPEWWVERQWSKEGVTA
jgi:hypothetical protein